MVCSVLIEIEASAFFEDEGVNWKWCKDNANFAHREACEFIVHVGDSQDDYAKNIIANMQKSGCTADFIQAYKDAAAAGAMRVLFYV